MTGKMDPNSNQCSIDDPFSDNAIVCPGLTLPRSFTRARHENVHHGVFSILSVTFSPSQSFICPYYEKQACGVSSNLSNNHSCTLILGLFGLANIRGNSCALILATTRRNQMRILFVFNPVWAFFRSLIAEHQTDVELDVPYTVIRAHSLMSETFVLTSDYLKDFNSFCFTEKGAPCS